ncbi:VOC family protein [Mangrovimonas sp. YM274]|uniref:VOC family protein n=1 Tax=Mangrovimonas sp. YM274 TaxID=3070660 RepID=UPI0027DEAB42|nr:bleomycin resistance protein [Mangrovimonas sp. YM274]WMI68528.1 bleomycin resistance protein [Mangrovimonas sp. YM274]
METQFHLSLPCLSIAKTTAFYTNMLDAKVGRSAQNWVDIDLFGHQITFTKCGPFNFEFKNYTFGGQVLPSFHFGVILDRRLWKVLFEKLNQKNGLLQSELDFLLGKTGEHQSFFIKDPNGYTVEFKCFTNPEEIFK